MIELGGYRLLNRIGAGGMGEVWVAEHALLGRRAAIKLLHPQFSADPEIVARFFNEARAATSIADPGIVQIFDYGRNAEGTAFIVMELLAGETLHARLRKQRPIPVADALRILRQVASTLGAAHDAGIVHRDLKPDNIFLTPDPEVRGGERAKILDFGIAKLERGSAVKTQTSAMMGTPLYMSPEQCKGAGEVDARADVYSLGCVLFDLVTGRAPFLAEGVGEIIGKHLYEPAPRVTSVNATVPAAVDDLIARCLEKDPTRRPGSGRVLAREIDRVSAQLTDAPPRAASVGLMATQPSGLADAAPPPHTTLSGSVGAHQVSAPPRPRSRRGLVAAGAGVAVVGGVIAVLVATHGSKTPATDDPVVTTPPAPPTVSIDAAVVAAADAAPTPPVDAPSPTAQSEAAIRRALAGFSAWASEHPTAACPKAAELAEGPVLDAWGHELHVTCVGQPANQRIGITSAGPDGEWGNGDDIDSWTLGRDAMALVAGPRWKPTPKVTATATAHPPPPPVTKPVTPPPADPHATVTSTTPTTDPQPPPTDTKTTPTTIPRHR